MSDMFAAISEAPQPVIARVHGAALGGGMGLIAACDIAVAADNSVFGFTEVRLGIIPAVISRFVLPKLGSSWARALYATGERFSPDVAQRTGLVHWVVPEADLDAAVRSKVDEILQNGPQATRAAKALVAELEGADGTSMRAITADWIARLRTSEEGQEGLRAFLERRKPSWITE
jgi:methylglutaconyl-CoA hydratase